MEKFKFLEHTADIKFKAYGKNINEVYKNSALAMIKTMFQGKIKPVKRVKFTIEGKDLENLMYEFLEEFLFLFDSKNFIPSSVKVNISKDNKTLKAELSGDSSKKYPIDLHVKAITYNDMFVKKIKNTWTSQVVLDI